MSEQIFSRLVGNYISAYEGHTEAEGITYIETRERLKSATIDEINTVYNLVTQQKLWTSSLIDLFFDELLDRLLNETTFVISTAWKYVSSWLNNSFVLIRIGFEENYPEIEDDDTYITGDHDNINKINIVDSQLDPRIRERIIKMILTGDVNVIIGYSETELRIVAVESVTETDNIIRLSSLTIPNLIRIKARIRTAPDWAMIVQMYYGLRTESPGIIDPFAERVREEEINQAEEDTE